MLTISTAGKYFYRICVIAMLILGFARTGHAQILHETGNLMEFLGGNSTTTAYDNYVSHISEGIARPGFNDYGPEWLDYQTNGFGDYRILPDNGSTLSYWHEIFSRLMRGDTQTVAQMVIDSAAAFHYEFVLFTDTVYARTYWMLRERLDSSFVDTNNTPDPQDDVVGSFSNGWGLYIFNPAAERNFVLVEVPHPTDDFIAPYVGMSLFQQLDARAFMIAGAGREVKWNEVGDYVNNSSYSDPARNANSLFETFHEVLCDSLLNSQPHAPLVLHTHSFDNNSAHAGYKSIVLSGGWDAGYVNKPIRDVTDDHLDVVNFTVENPIYAGEFGLHLAVPVTDYYQVHYDGIFNYYSWSGDAYPITHTSELLGPSTGTQMNYLRQFIPGWSVYEPWVQVELDEKPQLFDNLFMSLDSLYNRSIMPRGWRNFSKLLEYYEPFIQAMDAYLTNFQTVADTTAPEQIQNFHAIFISDIFMDVAWDPVSDTNFKTYRIYWDTNPVTENSPVWEMADDPHLSDMRTGETVVEDLPQFTPLNFRIAAVDYFGNESVISDSILNYIPDLETPQIHHRPLGDFPLENWPPRIMLENTSVIDFDSVWVETFDGAGNWLGRSDLNPYSWTRWIGELSVPAAIAANSDTLYYKVWLKEIAGVNPPYSYPDSGYFHCEPVPGARDLLNTDLEFNAAGFTPDIGFGTTRWQWGSPQTGPAAAYSGVHVWGTNLLGNYTGLSYCTLTTPDYDLNGFGFQYLVFYHWYDMEASSSYSTRAYDGGNIEISTDQGDTWTLLTPLGGYPDYMYSTSSPLHNDPVFSGTSNTWRRAICDLSEFVNDSIRFRFQFSSDANTNRPGWFLDDLILVSGINETPVNAVMLEEPADSAIWLPNIIHFQWTPASDPDPGADVRYDLFYGIDSSWQVVNRLPGPQVDIDLATQGWIMTEPVWVNWFVRSYSQQDTMVSPDTFLVILPPRSLFPMHDFALMEPAPDSTLLDTLSEVTFEWHSTTDPDPATTVGYQLIAAGQQDTLIWFTGPDTLKTLSLDTLLTLQPDSNGLAWWVMAISETEEHVSDSTFTLRVEHYVGTGTDPMRPREFSLSPAYPNPFNPSTNFRIGIPKTGNLRLTVYDLLGREVAIIHEQILQPGYYEMTWAGTLASGQPAASGLYLVRMQANGFQQTRKILLLR